MTRHTRRVAVSAGRYDRAASAVNRRIRNAIEAGAAAYLSTEVMRDQRPAFTQLRPAWRTVFRGEYAIAYDRTAYAPDGLRARLRVLSSALFPRGGPRNLVPVKALEHRVRDRVTGRRVTFTIAHPPAHLDAGGHYSTDPGDRARVRAHRQALTRAGLKARRRAHRHPDRAQVWAADVNVNLLRAEWRARLVQQLHPLSGVWTRDRLPDRGDLGDRLVVGAWAYGLIPVDGVVLRRDPGSDHALVIVDLDDPAAPR